MAPSICKCKKKKIVYLHNIVLRKFYNWTKHRIRLDEILWRIICLTSASTLFRYKNWNRMFWNYLSCFADGSIFNGRSLWSEKFKYWWWFVVRIYIHCCLSITLINLKKGIANIPSTKKLNSEDTTYSEIWEKMSFFIIDIWVK